MGKYNQNVHEMTNACRQFEPFQLTIGEVLDDSDETQAEVARLTRQLQDMNEAGRAGCPIEIVEIDPDIRGNIGETYFAIARRY